MNASTKKNTEYDSVNVNFRTMCLEQLKLGCEENFAPITLVASDRKAIA